MDTQRYKHALLQKQQELEQEISRQSADARDANTTDVEDPIDYVTSSESQAAAFEIGSKLTDILEAVHDALARMEAGSYGRCIDCDREIEPARLNAVPWTPYCKEHQEEHDATNQAKAASATTGDIS